MGAIKLESLRAQNYRFTRAQFEQRYHEAFG